MTDVMTNSPTMHLPPADTATPIEAPTTCAPYRIGDGITVLPSYLPVPGMGVLAAHAFLIDGPEPLLVDTGPGGAGVGFRAALASVIDPAALRWVWLTHTDPDHTGSLQWVLDSAPEARLITTFLGAGKLGMSMAVPMDRLHWLNPGATAVINGRPLQALRPPSFDAPETTACFDHSSLTLFSADSFGALLQRPVLAASDIGHAELAEGQALWSTIDSPWVTHTDRAHLDAALGEIDGLRPQLVLSSHLPPAPQMTGSLLDNLRAVVGADPWTGPDQAALEELLAQVTPA